MSSEEIISELDKNFSKNDQYNFLKYINKNIGVFISAISIVSAIVIFLARAISYLVVRAKYQFWDLEEGFLVEDNKAILKLGVYTVFILLVMLLNSFVKRFVYRLEFYNCGIYLLDKSIAYQHRTLKNIKKEINSYSKRLASLKKDREKIAKLSKSVTSSKKNKNEIVDVLDLIASIQKENDPIYEDLLRDHERLNNEYSIMNKRCSAIKKDIWKIRISIWHYFLIMILGVFVASILMLVFSGAENWDNGIVSLVAHAVIISLIIVFTAFICSFLEIRFTVFKMLKNSFTDKKIDWNSDCISQVIEWLQSKSDENQKQSIKAFFSDRSLKILSISVIVTIVFLTIFLQFNVRDGLKRLDSFYVFRDNQQNYVMLINDGTKYIFSGCEINENTLIIDTNEIIVRKDPVDLVKMQFESVERKQ